MPHQRKRIIQDILLKRLKLWPSLGIVGPRQCGKSTLLRDFIQHKMKSLYLSFDSKSARDRAMRSPESFSEPENKLLMIIDEAQKVPDIFDAVKLHIDNQRRPGMFILSGSTAFSTLSGVRESLTGRMGVLHLYPFCLSEIHQKKFGSYYTGKKLSDAQISLKDFDRKIEKGGMPGFFFLRSDHEWSLSAQQWIETTCYRDLTSVVSKNFNPELAFNILSALVQLEFPIAAEVAAKLNRDARVIKRYLEAFCEILVLKKVNSHPLGVGKEHFVLIDSGICNYLGASRETCLRAHALVEALSHFEAMGLSRPEVLYYRSEKRSYIPLIFYWAAKRQHLVVQISDAESPTRGELASVSSFQDKMKNSSDRYLLLNQASKSFVDKKMRIEFHPLRG